MFSEEKAGSNIERELIHQSRWMKDSLGLWIFLSSRLEQTQKELDSDEDTWTFTLEALIYSDELGNSSKKSDGILHSL